MRTIFFALLAGLSSAPLAAQNAFATQTPETFSVAADVYNRLFVGPQTPQEALASLNLLCESKLRYKQQRCERIWHRINAEYARMQEERLSSN